VKAIIQKVDLDTCLTALILGVDPLADEVIVAKGEAGEEELNDPAVICIEAGGSGRSDLNDFDHHDPDRYFEPACRQTWRKQGGVDDENPYTAVGNFAAGRRAWVRQGADGEHLARLVDYVCMVDERIPVGELPEFPTLSNIFSGMLLIEKEPAAQFAKGIAILRRVVAARLDPYDTMPDCEAWRPFAEAKEANFRLVKETLEQAEYYLSRRGRKVGYVESTAIGGIGTLYEQGCEVAVMFNPAFGEPPMPKYHRGQPDVGHRGQAGLRRAGSRLGGAGRRSSVRPAPERSLLRRWC